MSIHPRVVISRCIEFDHCRYNGEKIPSDFVLRLMPYVDFLPVCMESEMGLGVPRDPVRIVRIGDEDRLVQPATGRDVTELAMSFSKEHLAGLSDIDGFILKGRSPSCGVRDVRVYPPGERVGSVSSRSKGIFARQVLAAFPDVAVEDEARLTNLRIAEHFLIRVFTNARFRQAMHVGDATGLMDFHADHKLLLMGYGQERMRAMGRLAASKLPLDERYAQYRTILNEALRRPPRCRSWVNVLMHSLGHFSKDIGSQEREHFLRVLRAYTEGKMPLSVPVTLIRSWSLRFDDQYLQRQAFLEPYPPEFMELMTNDACSGRDLW